MNAQFEKPSVRNLLKDEWLDDRFGPWIILAFWVFVSASVWYSVTSFRGEVLFRTFVIEEIKGASAFLLLLLIPGVITFVKAFKAWTHERVQMDSDARRIKKETSA